MANEKQLEILKQGAGAWNMWRNSDSYVVVDLSKADLSGADLFKVNFFAANLKEANLSGSDLHTANLYNADLSDAKLNDTKLDFANLGRSNLSKANLRKASGTITNLSNADLTRANLREAYFYGADFSSANLTETNLRKANLSEADLKAANLHAADLREANLEAANLSGADLSEASLIKTHFAKTILANIDLGNTRGLAFVSHSSASTLGTDTISRSIGRIPEVFLRGCGLSDWEIESAGLYNPKLSNHEIDEILYKVHDLRASRAVQISPLFISYSHGDSTFVDNLESHLNKKGIRFWRDIHDMKAGRIETQIDRAINQNRTVILVLSRNSIKSDWVEHEVRTARALEKDMGRDMLCPVALDDSWKSSRWPKRLMEQIMEYNILDFSAWKDGVKFEGMFRKLIDGLELFYKG